MAVATAVLGLLALATPLTRAEFPPARVGALLALAGALEMLHALRRASAAGRRQAAIGAVISLAIAFLLVAAPYVAAQALRFVIAGWFAIDAMRYLVAAARTSDSKRLNGGAALGNAALAAVLFAARGSIVNWVVTVAGALRILGIAWNMRLAPVYTVAEAHETAVTDLGLGDEPEAVALAADIEAAEQARAPIDRRWTLAFLATLFAIHVGRMTPDRTLLGMIAPAVAVLGDMLIAVVVALLVINVVFLVWRMKTRWLERLAWSWYLGADARNRDWARRALAGWLRWRLTLAIRMRAMRYSIPLTLERSLQNGLPVAAIIAATVPVWGMSWYFDTENWAAGIWNSWAESRTDTWREQMVRAVQAASPSIPAANLFAVDPAIAAGDFSFIVIGDTGEGDASQHVLRDQLLSVAAHADVRFVVISSDVVYPSGAMSDYEAKFWLPFKGVTRPVYAIPGNHDWYDALEAFNVTFLQADAARVSIRARIDADLRATSTTESRIEELIEQAGRLRAAYAVPTGFQRAPFFEVQTDRFALIAIDTGVLRSIDAAEAEWLEQALTRASGKFIFAVVGHPFYAGGYDATEGDDGFAALKQMLLRHHVDVMMAGDTHDLEYYNEAASAGSPAPQYFVNGGGGAYLSFGTSLAWPHAPATVNWAYYPDEASTTGKIQTLTPWWKRPAWWWTRAFNAWPFTAEWLSAVFDYNVAPFFQSFVEVRVERSANRVRIIPYGVHGRLAWRDFARSPGLTASTSVDDPAEWIVPMNR
jgi:uncharacterized membrane protein HdeD (DUF308 family)